MNVNFSAARPWLLLSSFALGLSALLAILLVLSRAPHVQEWFGLQPLFHTILVLHVNFAVLVWLLSFIGFIWVYHLATLRSPLNLFALILCFVGAFLMLMSPFFGDVVPIMSNYVPVIDSPVFFLGLCLFVLAISLLGSFVIREYDWGVLKASAMMWFVALFVFSIHLMVLEKLDSIMFFERLFWGAGHVLQFVYVLILWLVWRWPNSLLFTFQSRIVLVIVLFALGFMVFLDPGSMASRQAYTLLMQGGMFLLLLPMLWWWTRQAKNNRLPDQTVNVSIASSAFLILLGIIIGLFIRDDSVIVTAHYHATNAAITVAFMGLVYRFIPYYSCKPISNQWQSIQLYLYASGMVFYVLGMAGSGLLGVPRKTAMMVDDSLERISMGIMGLGGALSILATLLFVGFTFYAFTGKYRVISQEKLRN